MANLPVDICGCCEGYGETVPLAVGNRPGLTAISYRIGTFARFRAAMLDAIAQQPALAGLTTRSSDDPAITLLELWAAIADILTFYQERIANEAWLRTGRERDSVLRLVRLIDYHLRPGLAATGDVVFTLDDGALVNIPIGLRVMSTPGQDEKPQVFETLESIAADARFNRLPILPLPLIVNPFGVGRQTVLLTADSVGWQAARGLSPGEKVVVFGTDGAVSPPSTGTTYGDSVGWNVPSRVAGKSKTWSAGATVQESYGIWTQMMRPVFGATPAPPDPNAPEEKEIKSVEVQGDRYLLVWTAPVRKDIWSAEHTHARAFRRKMLPFAHDAPNRIPAVSADPDNADPAQQVTWTQVDIPAATYALGSGDLPLDRVYDGIVVGDALLVYESGGDSQVVTVTGVQEAERIFGAASLVTGSMVDYRYRATVSVLTVSPNLNLGDRRNAVVYLLKGADIPVWDGDFSPLITEATVCLPAARLDTVGEVLEIGRTVVGGELESGVALRLDALAPRRRVLLEDHTGQPVSASVVDRRIETRLGQDFLVIELAILEEFALDTRTAVLLGNVAAASHGETVRDEIVGDGSADRPFQQFALSKSPLTYLPSSKTPRGESTLQLRVNGERWRGVDTLYGQPATARIFTARQSDDGTTLLRFGDGKIGARLPTGRGNLLATYRKGLGLEGRLDAGQLDILLDRPVGLSSVRNPSPTEGGADPERLEDAHENAPATVKTFGRAIALDDFAALVRESGEVANAYATWVWQDLRRAVHLTVAGQDGGLFSAEKLRQLYDGLTAARDPNHALTVANFCRVPITLTVVATVDADFVQYQVEDAVRAAVAGYFDFDARGFAEPVHLSDIYAVIQGVAGVVFVDIDGLRFKGQDGWTADQREARGVSTAAVQGHLRIFPARPRPQSPAPDDPIAIACFGSDIPVILPAEQAYLEDPEIDLDLTMVGGLS